MVRGSLCFRWLLLSAAVVILAQSVPTSSRSGHHWATSWQKKQKYQPQETQLSDTENEAAMAREFLSKFGYFRKGKALNLRLEPSAGSEDRPERDSDSEAIRMFQSYFGVRQTGQLDKDTLELMKRKRCGVPDIPEDTEETSSHVNTGDNNPSQYAVLRGQKWHKSRLTWKLEIPTQQIRHSEQQRTMREAFNTWRRVAPLDFIEKQRTDRAEVDINIQFGAKEHGDSYPFDGKGLVLAHAFGPGDYELAGDMHLDNDEKWTVDGDPGSSDLLVVAIHELGHSLGLDHSRDPDAIMYPFYGVVNTLGQDDIKGIQSLYGARIGDQWTTQRPRTRRPTTPRQTRAPYTKSPTYTQRPRPSSTPQPGSDVQFDVVIQADPQNRQIYTGIQGDRIYRFSSAGLISEHPESLQSVYPGAPSNAEAVFTVPEKAATYFVKDNQVWRFRHNQLDTGFPKALDPYHFPETIRFVLTMVDADGYSRVFVFGKTHWLEYNFDEPQLNYKRPKIYVIPLYWPHVSTDVKYAVRGTDNYFYFVSTDSHVVLDGHRRAMHSGKQNGYPEWMKPACRQIAANSEALPSRASNLHSFGPACLLAFFITLLFVFCKC